LPTFDHVVDDVAVLVVDQPTLEAELDRLAEAALDGASDLSRVG